MLHSPSGFPSRISCRIIGCDFSSPDTFTYRLLKAVSCKYHVANLYCAGDFWAHAVTGIGFPSQCRPYIKSGILKSVLSWNPQETGKVATYVLAAMEEGNDVTAIEIDGIKLKIDDTNVYHGCLTLDADNIDEYTYS